MLDLDKVERRIGDMDMDVRPLIAELRRLREENERLEADLDINTMKIRQLQAEHSRICNEHALLVQESGREGRELDRLEGLLSAWVKARGDDESEASKELWEEAARLAKASS